MLFLRRTFAAVAEMTCICLMLGNAAALAEVAISEALPAGLKPGEKTRVTIKGQEFASPLRVWTSCSAQVDVVSVEPTLVVLDMAVPATQSCGPFGLWIATPASVSNGYTMLVDDLPATTESASNHTLEQAHVIAVPSATDGSSDGNVPDYFRFHLDAGQRVAIELVSQEIGSAFDPVVKLMDANGRSLALYDDSGLGPEVRFAHQATEASDYVLQVIDNRYVAGGRYRLRVGDFPIVSHSMPLAVAPTTTSLIALCGADEQRLPAFLVPGNRSPFEPSAIVSARFEPTKPSSWVTLGSSTLPSYVEGTFADRVLPVVPHGLAIHGRLASVRESDRYRLQGETGQSVRIAGISTSLGSPAMLRFHLENESGAKIAETQVTDSDEFTLDYGFADSRPVTLVVSDLLNRGGADFGYQIAIRPLASLAVQASLKPDAKTRDRFLLDPVQGIAAVDVTLSRVNYDGPVEFRLADPSQTLRILNPTLVTGNETRLYVTSSNGWQSSSIASVRLMAGKPGEATGGLVQSSALHRLRVPHVSYPHSFFDGSLMMAGVESKPEFFNAQPQSPLVFARCFADSTLKWNLQRINPEFKDPVVLLPPPLPDRWNWEPKVEGDQLSVKLIRAADNLVEPEQLTLAVVGEFQQVGKMQSIQFPVRWIDPLVVQVTAELPIAAGQAQKIIVRVERSGDDPQPVTLRWKNLPAGLTGPEMVTIPADQSETMIDVQAAQDVELRRFEDLRLSATSQFAGREFTIDSKPFVLETKQP